LHYWTNIISIMYIVFIIQMLLAMYMYVLKYYVRALIVFNEEKCAGYIIDYSLDYIYTTSLDPPPKGRDRL